MHQTPRVSLVSSISSNVGVKRVGRPSVLFTFDSNSRVKELAGPISHGPIPMHGPTPRGLLPCNQKQLKISLDTSRHSTITALPGQITLALPSQRACVPQSTRNTCRSTRNSVLATPGLIVGTSDRGLIKHDELWNEATQLIKDQWVFKHEIYLKNYFQFHQISSVFKYILNFISLQIYFKFHQSSFTIFSTIVFCDSSF